MTLPAGTQIGKYIVRRKLAEGGMAEIYLCTSLGAEGFEKEVVIKRVRSFLASDPGFVEMFIAEARLASRLNHANVVQIFDFEKHEDTYYLAMEYVRGCTLWDLRRKCKEQLEPMPPVLVAHIGAEVARGLHYAHRLRVNGEPIYLVHRDVTPHNVLLSFDGAVKLTDFGIAKAGNKMTSPGMLKGKFAYMSPEQARGENVDVRTDVFALGIVLWEMLTGGRLFDGDSELAVLRAVQESAIAHPSRLNPDVPEALGDVVMKALERDPEARYQTAGELERALAQCVLNHARSVDDTDVGTFMRRLFGGAPSMALQAITDRTQQADSDAPPGLDGEPEFVPREPTAVLPGSRSRRGLTGGGGEGSRSAPAPDEDVRAPTQVLPSRGGSSVKAPSQSVPSVPAVPGPAAPASPPRTGLWIGLGLVALVAAVGVGILVGSRARSGEPTPAPVPTAVAEPSNEVPAPDAGSTVAVAPAAAPPEPPPVAQASPDAGTAVAVPEPAPPKAAPIAKGSLVIRAMPYATVLVNGRHLGEVQGQKTFKLAPGSYQLVLKHPEGMKTETIVIEPKGTVTREFRARLR